MKGVKIVLMNGGLGNQLYQYTFMRFLEIATNQKCIVVLAKGYFFAKEKRY